MGLAYASPIFSHINCSELRICAILLKPQRQEPEREEYQLFNRMVARYNDT